MDARLIEPLSAYRPNRPLLISGAGRSGTTAVMRAVARMLDWTTYFDQTASRNAEDELTPNLGDIGRLFEIVKARRASCGARWVSKVPQLVLFAAESPGHSIMADWFNLIVVTRDPVTVAFREPALNVLTAAHQAERVIRAALQLAPLTGVVVVPYERLLTDAQPTIRAIADWIGEPVEPLAVARGAAEVEPHDRRYRSGL